MSGVAPTKVPVRLRAEEPRHCCEAAARLAAYTEALKEWLTKRAITEERVNQAKLMLVERYMAERGGTMESHRDRVLGPDKRLCVYGVFLGGWQELHRIAMESFPPPLSPPKKGKDAPTAPSSGPTQRELFEENLPPEIRLPTA